MADNGLATVKSAHGVKDTIDRLAAHVIAKGMKVFCRAGIRGRGRNRDHGSRDARRGRKAGRRASRYHLPYCRHRLRRGGAKFREGLPQQPRRHAPLLEAVRRTGDGYRPKLIFTSSCAAYGAPFPDIIGDDFHLTPLTSYGTQKAMCELLLADYTRRVFVDGVGLRLPAICVRPGKPNNAASGFYSSIIREPLAGREAILPVDDRNLHTHASPRAAVGFLIHAAGLNREQLGHRINLTMPGVSCTVADQIDALRRIAGEKVAARIRREPDALVMRIVDGWPHRFEAKRARALGFVAERSFDDIIRVHIEDELGGVIG
jgi:hypothetical protein